MVAARLARSASTSAPSAVAEILSKPPRLIEDSTSALDYKYSHRRARPPPLPASDAPRIRSAEEAVTNILYNTPPPSAEPYKKHILNGLVQNEPGVLSRVSGILAGRGFNIDSLVVCRTEIRDLSRMCIVLSGQEGVVEQARRQLEDLVPVWAVLDYTETRTISRELLLVKVSILGPEYLDDQLLGGPSHDLQPAQQIPLEVEGHHHESKLLDREIVLAQSFERSGKSDKPATATSPAPPPPTQVNSTPPTNHNNHNSTNEPAPLTPSQLLQLKHGNLAAINTLSAQFGAKIVDVSENRVIVELSAKSHRVEAFLSLLRPFGILESARTGVMVMPRTPISAFDEEEATDEAGPVDASLLPPG